MSNNVFKYGRETVWILTGIICLSAGVHQTIQEGIKQSYMFFILTVLSFAMYSLRRNLRKRQANNSE